MKRQAATTKGIRRRIADLRFERVDDPRELQKVTYPLPVLFGSLVAAMVTMARSLREVEDRSEQFAKKGLDWLGMAKRVADNTYGQLLQRVDIAQLAQRLQGAVKAEHRRGNLKPTALPIKAAAIDGKSVATIRWHDLCRLLSLKPEEATPQQAKQLVRSRFPNLQFCTPKVGKPYALARTHTVTLISSDAACAIHLRPIPGATNEIGAVGALLKEMHKVYGGTNLLEMVTTDAGNTSLGTTTLTRNELGWHYFAQLKGEHGAIYSEAQRALQMRPEEQAEATYSDTQNGRNVTYHVWSYDLSEHGWLDWQHARQFFRVRRVTQHPVTGEKTVGNRFYVTSKDYSELKPKDAAAISRGHWRCEDENHWTNDALLYEDRRQLAWSRHPNGVYVVALLRAMALNILAVARRLSRLGEREETPTWHQVAVHFLLVLCETTLSTERFDDI